MCHTNNRCTCSDGRSVRVWELGNAADSWSRPRPDTVPNTGQQPNNNTPQGSQSSLPPSKNSSVPLSSTTPPGRFPTTGIFQVPTPVEKEGDLPEHLSIDAIKRSLPKTARKVRSNTTAAGDACPWDRLEHLFHAYVKSIDTRPGAVARGLGMDSAVRIWELVFQKEQFMLLMRDWLLYRHQWFGIRDILDSQDPASGKPRQWNKFLGKEIQAQAKNPELWREWARDERPGTVHPILDHMIPEILKGEVFRYAMPYMPGSLLLE
ncbi:uncharacterized protein BO72DRAFT_459999 [Aspergillus fijiensis CBS 313.89]|uniref:Uncharacterized protein n=1 Tax=Aspergillus fijiensis CBS 313.89 TaxID=1448319 RepID=A0A8G1RSD3_9EURO|nr:uncharacterized protein BO72DRAFT_459999 [Aspergillus fijiensis CBS 313.89]RAK75846.1 hypothetical protein BO72DRAFT_459999 [Aspergillus fijiensis CBS 313.89]